MARETLPRLRSAALHLFAEQWYDAVSVAEICRRAGVSNGAFYRYFPGKQALFFALLEDFLSTLEGDLAGVTGTSFKERLQRFVHVVARAARRYAGEVNVFREGQYRFPQFEERIRALYVATAERLYGRPISEVEYLYLLSGLRFVATRSLLSDLEVDEDLIVELLYKGVFEATDEVIELTALPDPAAPPGDSPHDRLLHEAVGLIGERGFYAVQVVDIARAAGYSVGTFYNHFSGKDAFLAELVRDIGRRTRHFLRDHQVSTQSRWLQEVHGMWNFLHFFSSHPEYYEIVREAEFVVPQSVHTYYDDFQRGYVANLSELPPGHRATAANFLMGISHYLGIEVLFQKRVRDVSEAVRELGRLLAHGLSV
ncbi:MAG: TetR/AcrR family transcriptional regulator [Spirochaetaceae bacterium]